jgi:predicted dehydrogenase
VAAVNAPHTLLFLDPGHFHAALTLRVRHPRVADEVVVYAPDGPELRDFAALVGRFNTRPMDPTRWRLDIVTAADPLARLLDERRGDVVVLAGRNGGKARTIRRLHEAGFHVLADKPWLVGREDLDHVRASLGDWPLAMEIMTGRHDVHARLWQRLVSAPAVFGAFPAGGTAIEFDSVHCLEKRVDGAPLRRPWWFFDVRVQGSGAVDIPTHLVDRTQWLLEGTGLAPAEVPHVLAAHAWATSVPVEAFRAITGLPGFPAELAPFLDGDALAYRCNARLEYRLGGVAARAETRWDLRPSPGGGDTNRAAAHGTRSTVRLEQSAATGHRRTLVVDPRDDTVGRAVEDAVRSWQAEFPGVRVERAGADAHVVGADAHVVAVPAALDGGHETHFAQVLDAFLTAIDERRWPAALAGRTLAKYAFLAEVAAA